MTYNSNFIEQKQSEILEIYLSEIHESDRQNLIQFLPNHLQNLSDFFKLEKSDQLIIGNHLARISDLQSRIRRSVRARLSENISDDPFALSYTLKKFKEQKISPENLQQILNQIIISNSITAHPTNPYSTEYTIASMEFDRLLFAEKLEISSPKIRVQIKKMIDLEPTPSIDAPNKGKKTQKDEVIEAMSYMKNIYEFLPLAKRKIEEILRNCGYENFKIGKFYEMCVWLSGDGDGNPTATAEALQQNIDLFREEILKLYQKDLGDILDVKSFATSDELMIALKKLPKNEKIEDLIYRVENFGFYYSKIDVRHDATEIGIAAEEIRKFEDQNPDEILQNLTNEIAIRIFKRFLIVAKNPEFFDKLIIAECKKPEDVLSALLLLKAAKTKDLSIVTLSESADDLINLPQNIESLLENETYRNYVVKNGKLIYMIAKSDTQRRDGVGAQYAQEIPPEKITDLFIKLTKKYPELKNVKLIPFNGGGHALQRGGGRIDEIPNVYGKAIMRGIYWNNNHCDIEILPPILTTQGHQNGILFSASNTQNFLISYFSQSLLAAAKIKNFVFEEEIFENDGSLDIKAQKARKNRKIFFENARKIYHEEIATPDTPINKLFAKGPWAGIDLTNVSSRPSKRVENSNLQLIDQRAIGAERMCAHSGTHLISWYSAKAGLQALDLQDAKLMYENDKATRDSFRSMAMSLFMTDFDIAWQMMIGKPRPALEQIKILAAKYKKEQSNEITLAHIEIEAIETAKLICRIIANEELSDLAPKELLKKFWPNLAIQIENREAKLKFAHLVEAKLTFDLPDNEKRYPKDKTTENLIRVFNTACVGTETPALPMFNK